jgi:beta-glucosidase
LTEPATVRASFVFTPQTTGVHVIRTGGAGDLRVLVDGREVGALPAQGSLDKTGEILWPPLLEVAQSFTSGTSVQVVIELHTTTDVARSLHLAVQPPPPEGLLQAAVAAAAAADMAIVVVGETTDNAMESVDRTSTRLPGAQPELIEQVCAANPRTVVIVNAGHAVDMPWADKAAAVIMAWFPGEQFGPALADVITGRREPGGRLPLTIARVETDYPAFDLTPVNGDLVYEEGTLIGGRWLEARGVTPRYPLGHGLGYTRFDVSTPRAEVRDGAIVVAVDLRNIGDRTGKAVLQLYVKALDDADNPASELKDFKALTLQPGASAEAVFTLGTRAFAHWDVAAQRWAVRPGRFAIRLGRSLTDIVGAVEVTFDAKGQAALA